MAEYILIHNPACSKSRQSLEILKRAQIKVEMIHYLEQPLSKAFLVDLFIALCKKPGQCIRTNEEQFKALKLDLADDDAVIAAIIEHPIILQRPILLKISHDRESAIIGRPVENIEKLIRSL